MADSSLGREAFRSFLLIAVPRHISYATTTLLVGSNFPWLNLGIQLFLDAIFTRLVVFGLLLRSRCPVTAAPLDHSSVQCSWPVTLDCRVRRVQHPWQPAQWLPSLPCTLHGQTDRQQWVAEGGYLLLMTFAPGNELVRLCF